MKFSELIDHAVECIKTFNPVIKTIDSHADSYLEKFQDPYERVFVKQIFYGCIRYEDFLKTFVKVFFELHSATTNRNDAVLYQIFAYMTFFRLEELSTQDFRKLIVCQEPTKMNVFLLFAFNADKLREHLREPWMEFYDFQYIDDRVIGLVERNLPNVAEILKHVERRATGKITGTLSMTQSNMQQQAAEAHSATGRSSMTGDMAKTEGTITAAELMSEDDNAQFRPKPVTVQEPFHLTKLKPKMIPAPEPIKREVIANPIPKNLNRKSLAEINEEKKERREGFRKAIRNDYEIGAKQRFPLATEGLKSNKKIDQVRNQLEAERTKEHRFDDFVPREMPNFQKKPAAVKINVAHMKREGHLLEKQEAIEMQKINEMAMGLKDASEFNRWKREMDQKDDVERLEHIAKKKIEMELAREEAILAQQRQEQENKKLVIKMKIEAEKRQDEREANTKIDFDQRRTIIEQVHTQKDNAGFEMEQKRQENKAIRDVVKIELDEALKRKKDEELHELAKRQELIRQIRELEKIPIQRTKGFDPTEAGGHGLMVEMSVAELRERLEYVKRQQAQEVDFQREKNLHNKEIEAENLMIQADKIQQSRQKRKQDQDTRRYQKQKDADDFVAKQKAAREKGLLEAHERINQKKIEKREEEERLAKELKEIKLQRQYRNANAAMVEMKAWKELEAGKERQIRDGQNDKLIGQCKVNQISVKDQTVRADNAKTSVMDKLKYDRGYQDRLNTRKRENEVLHKGTLEYKSDMHGKQKNFETDLAVKQRKRQPFNQKINEQSLHKAAEHREKLQKLATMHAAETLVEDYEQDAIRIAEANEEWEEEDEGPSALDIDDGTLDDIQAKLAEEVH